MKANPMHHQSQPFKPAAFTSVADRVRQHDALLAPLEHFDALQALQLSPVRASAASCRFTSLPQDQRTLGALQGIVIEVSQPEIQIQIEAEYDYRFPLAGEWRQKRQNAISRDAKLATNC
jgi:hypothetical protein